MSFRQQQQQASKQASKAKRWDELHSGGVQLD